MASLVLLVFLLVADIVLQGTNLFVYATFMSLCDFGGPPYCEPDSLVATLVTYAWFGVLFAVAWPLVFGSVTWGLPGESGVVHGFVFGLVLWSGYVAVVLVGMGFGGETLSQNLPLLGITFVSYVVYGVVLGGAYDSLAEHRTFLSEVR